jgi:hypothetical protein
VTVAGTSGGPDVLSVPAEDTGSEDTGSEDTGSHLAIISASCPRSVGLERKSFIPALRQRSRSVRMESAVSAMIGIPGCVDARMTRVAAKPSITGISQSISTRS